MGCASSREARHGGYDDIHPHGAHRPPLSRSYSMPFQRMQHRRKHQDGLGHHRHHIVSLTSTTLGSLAMDPRPEDDDDDYDRHSRVSESGTTTSVDCEDAESMKKHLNDGKLVNGFSSPLPHGGGVWTRVPRTPTMTPPHTQPETINAWEILDGLDDISPICRPLQSAVVERSRSFHATLPQSPNSPAPVQAPVSASKSPIAPALPATKSPQSEESKGKPPLPPGRHLGLVRSRIMAFQERINARRRAKSASCASINVYIGPPGGEGKVVVYLTSLRGVRRTYEDCNDTVNILRGYGVRLDERDLSMDAGFKAELTHSLFNAAGGGGSIDGTVVPIGWGLPRVFANGRCLGGAEELRQLHESGKLKKMLDGCRKLGKADTDLGPCASCGDVRFVPCETCSGSCRVFVETEAEEDIEQGDDEREESEEDVQSPPVSGEFRRCTDCNENGLIRCPVCCTS